VEIQHYLSQPAKLGPLGGSWPYSEAVSLANSSTSPVVNEASFHEA